MNFPGSVCALYLMTKNKELNFVPETEESR
jgi:hypothetical protein